MQRDGQHLAARHTTTSTRMRASSLEFKSSRSIRVEGKSDIVDWLRLARAQLRARRSPDGLRAYRFGSAGTTGSLTQSHGEDSLHVLDSEEGGARSGSARLPEYHMKASNAKEPGIDDLCFGSSMHH